MRSIKQSVSVRSASFIFFFYLSLFAQTSLYIRVRVGPRFAAQIYECAVALDAHRQWKVDGQKGERARDAPREDKKGVHTHTVVQPAQGDGEKENEMIVEDRPRGVHI